jgi:hypothetical protein
MKNYEVGIVIAAIIIIGWFYFQNQSTAIPANPTNAASPGYTSGPSWFGGPVG